LGEMPARHRSHIEVGHSIRSCFDSKAIGLAILYHLFPCIEPQDIRQLGDGPVFGSPVATLSVGNPDRSKCDPPDEVEVHLACARSEV